MDNRRLLAALTLAVLAALPASATSYVPVADAPLTDQSDLVIEGTVLATRVVWPTGRPRTQYTVQVDNVLKGNVTGETVRVQVVGGRRTDGRSLRIWGAPELAVGDRTLLFLGEAAGGAYQPLHLSLGVFHRVDAGGAEVALRDPRAMAELEVADGANDEEAGKARDLAGFRNWIADRAAGLVRPADYFVEPRGGMARMTEKFTYIGGNKSRWFEFDRGVSVSWRAHEAGQQGLPSGGFPEFQAALAAWNDDPKTNIRYRYDGKTSASLGFSDYDAQNVILFHDPHDDAEGVFQCGGGGGILAVGGTWYDDSGPQPYPIASADIVVNDGTACWLTSSKRAEQLYGHELGHTLGLGHSCGGNAGLCDDVEREALMRASAHDDDRGAALNADDQAGILSLYKPLNAKPAAPTGLRIGKKTRNSVKLKWTDNAANETSYRVEVKIDGRFREVLALDADVESVTISGLAAGTTYELRVRARNKKGYSAYSNVVSVTTRAPKTKKR